MTIWMQLARFACFETERLLLRPFSYDDRTDFYEIVSNSENLSFIFPSIMEEELATATMVEKFMRSPLGNWALADKVSGQMIGALCFEKIDERVLTAELSYFLRKDYWGQGLMTEAVRSLVFFAFYEIKLRELYIVTHLENTASQMVAKKAGFQQVEQYRGSDRYGHKMRNYLKFRLKRTDFSLEMYEDK
ncbi:GNAT family N-acetyltransferase [Streptococcus ruminantium]|uniref:GNAT family N-acetyltransferase n=1 Tax=Streptococcus ruminantium TaxID=1917441 RepID=UPI001F48F0DC|nr:GNAT family N-acetyltransferase [Streptococcus ruminantium]BDD40235.1 N-acetyltransferase [Streptococcus ruminantium]